MPVIYISHRLRHLQTLCVLRHPQCIFDPSLFCFGVFAESFMDAHPSSVENHQEPPQAVYTPPVPLSSALTPRDEGQMGWGGCGWVMFVFVISDFISFCQILCLIWKLEYVGKSECSYDCYRPTELKKHRKHMTSSIVAFSFFHLKGSRVGSDDIMMDASNRQNETTFLKHSIVVQHHDFEMFEDFKPKNHPAYSLWTNPYEKTPIRNVEHFIVFHGVSPWVFPKTTSRKLIRF